MEDKDLIKDLFNEQLSGFEAPVRPEIWSQLSTNLASQVVVTSTSVITKVIIAATTVATISGLVYWLLTEESHKSSQVKSKTEQVSTRYDEFSKDSPKSINQKSPQIFTNTINDKSQVDPVFSDVVMETSFDEFSLPKKEQVETLINIPATVNPSVSNNQVIPKIEKDVEIVQNPIISGNEKTSVEEINVLDTETKVSIGSLINVFTPNGDRVNDYLSVESYGLTDFQVIVLDQNNKVIFQSTDPQFLWDGIGLNGEPAPSGNYVYFITARSEKGEKVNKYSTLRIER